MFHNFSDLSKLSPQAQAKKLKNYRPAVQDTVANFLAHFVGSETFYQRPEVTVKMGIPPTALQMTMMDCGVQIEGFHGTGWYVPDVLKKLQEQEYHDVAEVAMTNFEQLKGPMKIRAQLLKSYRLHVKDLMGLTAHLTSVPLPIRHPDEEDLENLIGWNSATRYAIKDLEESQNNNQDSIYEQLDRLEEMLEGLATQMRAFRVSKEIRDGKENIWKPDA